MEACKAEIYQTTKSTYRIISELLKGGVNINFKNKYGNTPLMYAINRKNFYLVSYLLSKGADPLINDSNGKNALKKVVLTAVYDSLKNDSLRYMLYTLLQSKSVTIDGKDKNGTTALMEAVKSGLGLISYIEDWNERS
jgi:ankyrin repeat protein